MPIKGGSYATKTTKTGKKLRLHFTKSGKVDEVKNLKTGKKHTQAEFKRDAAKRKKK